MSTTNPNPLPTINSHNSWSRLEEAWLGDVYPAHWYDHLDTAVRDVFYHLTEITKQDLDCIACTMQQLGVHVRRPQYDSIDDFLDPTGNLIKPQICPRDDFVVIGNALIGNATRSRAWQTHIDDYIKDPRSCFEPAHHACINGANVVRVGRDIIIDRDVFDFDYQDQWPDYRVTVVANGGHMDGCFAILRPGLILANRYYQEYDTTFPGWEIIMLDDPTYAAAPSTGWQQPYPIYNGKFWNTGLPYSRSFNQHVIQHALDWVGCYTETYFELNCLVVDENQVIMLADNAVLADTLAAHGITIHWVPFRTRCFWDGAMHCLTLDIRRHSSILDYFPERSRSWH